MLLSGGTIVHTPPSAPSAPNTTTHIEWKISDDLVPYPQAMAFMEERIAQIADGSAPGLVWLLEHPPLYTAGTSADHSDLLDPNRFPVYHAGRGGQYTYHGPGQRVAYVMLDLHQYGKDIRKFVHNLEQWMIDTLYDFGITGERRDGRVGIWVQRDHAGKEDKIGAIGVRVRKWVTFHGIALNVDPDLSHFGGIVPCGISQHGVTSIWDLGHTPTMEEVDMSLQSHFSRIFTP
jgi:lipoyl(octanoyl) transferase